MPDKLGAVSSYFRAVAFVLRVKKGVGKCITWELPANTSWFRQCSQTLLRGNVMGDWRFINNTNMDGVPPFPLLYKGGGVRTLGGALVTQCREP